MSKIKNAKLESIANRSAEDLKAFIKEAEDQILEAWSKAEQEAQDNETKPKFKLGFSITLNLDEDKMTTELSWSVKHKLSRDGSIPDPNQTEMELATEAEQSMIGKKVAKALLKKASS